MDAPEGLYYTEKNYWISVDGTTARIGLTDRGQKDAGDIVYIEVKPGSYSAGDKMGDMESVKTIDPVIIPISGKVTEVNGKLRDSPQLINESPYAEGWIAVVELSDVSELDAFMDASAYSESD